MLAILEGSHRIIHNTVDFETLQLVASVAGNMRAKFYLATIITRMIFTSFLSRYAIVSQSLGPLVFHFVEQQLLQDGEPCVIGLILPKCIRLLLSNTVIPRKRFKLKSVLFCCA